MSLSDLKAIDFSTLPIFEERESNVSFINARRDNSIGDITNLRVGLSGQFDEAPGFGDIKDVDFYHFTVSKPTQFNAILETENQAFQDIVSLNLFTDFNDDGVNNDGVYGDGFPDQLDGTPTRGADEIEFDRLSPVNQNLLNQLAPGEYYLAVSNITVDGNPIDYQVKLEAPELEAAQLNLNLTQIAPDRDRRSPVRFEVEVGGQVFERRFENDFEGITLPFQLDPTIQQVDIKIRAFQLNADGSETRIDLNTTRGNVEFEATYDTLSGKLFKRGQGGFPTVNEGQGLLRIARNETRDADGRIEPGVLRLFVTYDTTADLSDPGAPEQGNPVIDSNIIGTDGDDILDGDNADNQFLGFGGDDTLNGKRGNDVLQGAGNPNDPNDVGKGEIDRLNGGAGEDTFVLHTNNGMTVLYDEGNRRNPGKQDFAIIEDFNKNQDTIELAGSREEYFIGRSNVRDIADGRAIFRDTDNDGRLRRGRDELVAVVEGLNNLSFDDLEFVDIPVTVGSNRAERLQGSSQDGIIDGRGKRDRISAKGGDDVLLGGLGNDVLNGGSGDDILDGGPGNDEYIGKAGNDTFVVCKGQGSDRVQDFQDGVDVIGLAKGLAFEDLDIVQRGNKSIISTEGEKLAVVKGVQADQLGSEDFVSVDYTRFEGMRVPVALGLAPTVA